MDQITVKSFPCGIDPANIPGDVSVEGMLHATFEVAVGASGPSLPGSPRTATLAHSTA